MLAACREHGITPMVTPTTISARHAGSIVTAARPMSLFRHPPNYYRSWTMTYHLHRRPWPGRRVVDSGCTEPGSAWRIATSTPRDGVPRNGLAAGVPLRRAGALRARSVLPGRMGGPLFLSFGRFDRGQPRVGHHHQGDVTMPTRPETDFVVVEAHLALGHAEPLPPLGRPRANHGGHGRGRRRIGRPAGRGHAGLRVV